MLDMILRLLFLNLWTAAILLMDVFLLRTGRVQVGRTEVQ